MLLTSSACVETMLVVWFFAMQINRLGQFDIKRPCVLTKKALTKVVRIASNVTHQYFPIVTSNSSFGFKEP